MSHNKSKLYDALVTLVRMRAPPNSLFQENCSASIAGTIE